MSKTGLNGSLQNKNGKLYAVIGYNDVVTQKRKMKWISLGLDENDKKSVINRALRDAISDFEDEYDKMLSGLRSPEDYPMTSSTSRSSSRRTTVCAEAKRWGCHGRTSTSKTS